MSKIDLPAEIGSTIYYVRGDINRVLSGKVVGFEYNSLLGEGVKPVVNSDDIVDGKATYPVKKFYLTYEQAAQRLAELQEPFPILATLRKLDQKNRVHIPTKYLHLVGIEEGSEITITCDSKQGTIFITKVKNPRLVPGG